MTMLCKACATTVEPVLRWAGKSLQHVKATCPDCGAYIAFVTQTPDVVFRVGPKPIRPETPDLFGEVGG